MKKDLKILIILLIIFTWPPMIYLMYTTIKNYEDFKDELIAITKSSAFNIKVYDAYNDRGLFIINDSLSISSYTNVFFSTFKIEDPALWRPKNGKFEPTISDIEAPYSLFKKSK